MRTGLVFTTRDFRSAALEKTRVSLPNSPQKPISAASVAKVGLASFRPQTSGFTFGLRVWRNVSVRIVDVFPEFCLIERAISAEKSLPT
jgi:hypothetical protein